MFLGYGKIMDGGIFGGSVYNGGIGVEVLMGY